MAFESLLNYQSTIPVWALVLVSLWILIWKGFALWKSARNNSKIWFVVILIINTLGILEILYIFVFSKLKFDHLSGKSALAKKKK